MADGEENQDDSDLPGIGSIGAFSKEALKSLVKATHKSNELPAPGEDHEFYYSFSDFREFKNAQGNRLLSNIGKLLTHWHVHWPVENAADMEIDDLSENLTEANDILLENVDTHLDECAGLVPDKSGKLSAGNSPAQQSSPMVSSWNVAKGQSGGKRDSSYRFLLAKNIQRPQLKFKDKIDNSNTPFIPVIKYKPNAVKPLQQIPRKVTVSPEDADVPAAIADFIHQQRVQQAADNPINSTAHPYEHELQTFNPPEEQLKEEKEKLYETLEGTPCIMVDTVELLDELTEELQQVTEFAVDLEHHSYRSFQGFVCLMQISTRNRDYLVDTLELRNELHILNHWFTDPKILKVFHGADMDVGWLQRDFGLYVVNMFDTGQAARVLGYEKLSLAFLLKKFCGVTANKQYQLADWRIRPLPSEMTQYAREDTHYLLYIYDRMRNELIRKGNAAKNLLKSVYSRSKDICLKRYEKHLFTSQSYETLFKKHKKPANPRKLFALRQLYTWRDKMARQEDESYGYVLPNHMMFQIAEALPREAQGVLACCNPVPTLVKQCVMEIHMLIVEARDAPLSKISTVSPSPDPSRIVSAPDGAQERHQYSIPAAKKQHAPLSMGNIAFKGHVITGPPVTTVEASVSIFALVPQDTGTLTKSQRKAEKIKASIQNPFAQFLPLNTQSVTTTGQSEIEAQSRDEENKINQQWKEAVATESRKKKEASSNEIIEVTSGKRARSSSESSDTEDLTPLRKRQTKSQNMAEKPRKKKRTSNGKREEAKATPDSDQFVPFHYTSEEYSKLAGGDGEKSEGGKAVFNPYNSKGQKNKTPRSKVHKKSGEKSMTFTKNKSVQQKQQWPRR